MSACTDARAVGPAVDMKVVCSAGSARAHLLLGPLSLQ